MKQKKKACESLDFIQKDNSYGNTFTSPAKVIPAWEPLAEHLRLDIHFLKQTSQVKRETVDEITEALEDALRVLQGAQDED
jgi:hypothetical protein